MDTFGAGLVHDWALEDEEIAISTSPHPDNEGKIILTSNVRSNNVTCVNQSLKQ